MEFQGSNLGVLGARLIPIRCAIVLAHPLISLQALGPEGPISCPIPLKPQHPLDAQRWFSPSALHIPGPAMQPRLMTFDFHSDEWGAEVSSVMTEEVCTNLSGRGKCTFHLWPPKNCQAWPQHGRLPQKVKGEKKVVGETP